MAFDDRPAGLGLVTDQDTLEGVEPMPDDVEDRHALIRALLDAGVAANLVDACHPGIGAVMLDMKDGSRMRLQTGSIGLLVACDRSTGVPIALSGASLGGLRAAAFDSHLGRRSDHPSWGDLLRSCGLAIIAHVERLDPTTRAAVISGRACGLAPARLAGGNSIDGCRIR